MLKQISISINKMCVEMYVNMCENMCVKRSVKLRVEMCVQKCSPFSFGSKGVWQVFGVKDAKNREVCFENGRSRVVQLLAAWKNEQTNP